MGVFRANVNLQFAAGDGGGTNSWTLRTLSDDGTTTEVESLMGHVEDFYDAIFSVFPDNYTISWDGSVTQIGTPTPGLLAAGTPWTVNGLGGVNYGPAAAMICVSWKSSLATRRGRGRTFLGPVSANAVQGSDGSVTDTVLTTVRTAANALVSASLADTNGALAVWSELDQVARDFTSASVTDQVAVLRSRR